MDTVHTRLRKIESALTDMHLRDQPRFTKIEQAIFETKEVLAAIITRLEEQKKQLDGNKQTVDVLASMPQIT